MSVIVAVDGGGSRCRLAAFNQSGDLLTRVSINSHASLTMGPQAAWRSIAQGINSLATKLGKETSWKPDLLMMGLAGALKQSRKDEILQLIPSYINCRLVSDGHAQLVGASGGEPGICLAVGTGSVLHWLDSNGRLGMAGGWGYPVGDEGSGAWLGMQALKHYVWHLDGRRISSAFIESLNEQVGSSVSDIQHWTTQSESSVLAQIAPLVFEHAANGDSLAQSIVTNAVRHCMNLVNIAPADLPVYVVGGVGEQLRPLLQLELQERLYKARGDALRGLWQLSQQKNRTLLCEQHSNRED